MKNKDDLIRNINESNSNTLHVVESINSDMTKYQSEKGIFVQNLRISPHVLAIDKLFNVDFGHSINNQRAHNCLKPQSYKDRSECSCTDYCNL